MDQGTGHVQEEHFTLGSVLPGSVQPYQGPRTGCLLRGAGLRTRRQGPVGATHHHEQAHTMRTRYGVPGLSLGWGSQLQRT